MRRFGYELAKIESFKGPSPPTASRSAASPIRARLRNNRRDQLRKGLPGREEISEDGERRERCAPCALSVRTDATPVDAVRAAPVRRGGPQQLPRALEQLENRQGIHGRCGAARQQQRRHHELKLIAIVFAGTLGDRVEIGVV